MKVGVWSRSKTSQCNLVESKEIESLESENTNKSGENNFDCIFYARDTFMMNTGHTNRLHTLKFLRD
jgi:hypothetical protein